MPTKSFDQPDTTVPVNHTYTYISGPDCPNSWSKTETTKIKRGHYEGDSTPHFYKRKKAGGLLPLNAYKRFDAEVNSPHGIYSGRYVRPISGSADKVYNYSVNSVRSIPNATIDLGAAELISVSMTEGVNTNALMQAATANARPELDAGTLLAEMHKTVDLFTGARSRAVALINKARRLDMRRLEAISDAWLEWRYGWRILGYDIQSAIETFNHPFRDEIAEGRAGLTVNGAPLVVNHPFSGYYVSHDYMETIERSVSVRASVAIQYSYSSLNAGLSLPITAWELIPFSFVSDWFVSIGDVIAAYEVLQNAAGFEGSISTRFSETGTAIVSGVGVGTGTYATLPHASGGASSSATLLTRNRASRPSLTPEVRVKLSPAKIADILAIFAKPF